LDDRTARQGRELMTITIALTGPRKARKGRLFAGFPVTNNRQTTVPD
jgi:hypothetical protein